MAELNGNERAAVIGQLVAMRNVLDGVLASLQETEPPPCEHPLEQREYAGGVMGVAASFTCQQCEQTINPGV